MAMPRTTHSCESRITAVMLLLAVVTGCASSKPNETTRAVPVQVEAHSWVGQSADWMLENHEGLLRDWTLPSGGEEWLYENPRPRPDEPRLGCSTRNFLLPENPTHLVCFGADRLVTRVIRRGEPGWRVLPLPEPSGW